MSEQSQILSQMQEIIMKILKNGQASPEEGQRLDELEAKLYEQKCFEESKNRTYQCKGEEIAYLFFANKYEMAIEKMSDYEIMPEDFFGFAQYHFEDEEEADMFTQEFVNRVANSYASKR